MIAQVYYTCKSWREKCCGGVDRPADRGRRSMQPGRCLAITWPPDAGTTGEARRRRARRIRSAARQTRAERGSTGAASGARSDQRRPTDQDQRRGKARRQPQRPRQRGPRANPRPPAQNYRMGGVSPTGEGGPAGGRGRAAAGFPRSRSAHRRPDAARIADRGRRSVSARPA